MIYCIVQYIGRTRWKWTVQTFTTDTYCSAVHSTVQYTVLCNISGKYLILIAIPHNGYSLIFPYICYGYIHCNVLVYSIFKNNKSK